MSDSSAALLREGLDLSPCLLTYLTSTIKSAAVQGILTSYGNKTLLPTRIRPLLINPNLSAVDTAFLHICDNTLLKDPDNAQFAAAVERQASFVAKMDAQLWIRSPAAASTLRRAVERYSKFLKLFKLYPRAFLVPTLDIDLAWHTHQLSPSNYNAATKALAGRFLNHDDTLAKRSLDRGLEETRGLFRVRFGCEYLVCTCWDCQALMTAVEGIGDGTAVPDQELDDGEFINRIADDIGFHRAVEIARRAKRPLPVRKG
jgi:Glycine-rich domain-containing protein-like